MRSVLENKTYSPTAVVTSNEIQAWGAIKTFQELQINIPQEMAIVSMGGSSLSGIGYPNLTTIDFSPRKIGRESAKMLIEVIERKRIRPSQLIVPGKLIERKSI
jgi:DNA-binding LacI/PurR family transcriptional regulator